MRGTTLYHNFNLSLFSHSNVWYGVYGLVSHRRPSGAGPHVVRLLPLHRLGGHHLLFAGWVLSHLLLLRVLITRLSGQQSFLLLQTGRWQCASSPLHQSRQKRPRLRWRRDSVRDCSLYIETSTQAHTPTHIYIYTHTTTLYTNLYWKIKKHTNTLIHVGL